LEVSLTDLFGQIVLLAGADAPTNASGHA
jgi:hypothetical protein